MSVKFLTNPPRVKCSPSTSTVADSTVTPISWLGGGSSIDFDPGAATANPFLPSTNTKIYPPTPGRYIVIAHAQLAANATGYRLMDVIAHDSGGSTTVLIGRDVEHAPSASYAACLQVSGEELFRAGDWVTVELYQTSGASRTLSAADVTLRWVADD